MRRLDRDLGPSGLVELWSLVEDGSGELVSREWLEQRRRQRGRMVRRGAAQWCVGDVLGWPGRLCFSLAELVEYWDAWSGRGSVRVLVGGVSSGVVLEPELGGIRAEVL